MTLRRLLSGDPARSSILYLAIGGLSLLKAIAVRHDRDRFRRELLDAALFIGVGLALRRYARVKAQKSEEIREAVPNWVLGESASQSGLRDRAMNRFGAQSAPEPESSLGERARQLLA